MDEKQIEDLKKFAESYWKGIDTDALRPIFHGPEPTQEQRDKAREQMEKIEKLTKQYREEKNIPEPNDVLFPKL